MGIIIAMVAYDTNVPNQQTPAQVAAEKLREFQTQHGVYTEIRLGQRINMRSGPGTQHDKVTTLSKGAVIYIEQQDTLGWAKVHKTKTDSTLIGYVLHSLVRHGIEQARIAEAARTKAAYKRREAVAVARIKANTVESEDLATAYDQNEIRADIYYKGKTIYIRGIIESIGKDIMDNPYVVLKGASWRGVQCSFEDSRYNLGKIARLYDGQTVTIKGTVTGLMMNVQLDDCTLQ